MTQDIHRAVWKARTIEDLDALVREAGERIRANLADLDSEGRDWQAHTALSNARSHYSRLGMSWWLVENHLNKVADSEATQAAGDVRLKAMARRRMAADEKEGS